jgi:hypothetical protein
VNALERFSTLRQSRLATFDRCALSAKFEEEFRSGWSGHPQARGTIFHRFAAKALQAMAEQQENTLPTDLAIAILHETLRQHDIDQECPTCGKPVIERKEGRIRCAEGHDHHSGFVNLPSSEVKDLRWIVVKWANDNAFDIANLVDIEQRLSATISYPGPDGSPIERKLTGQLDALFVTGVEDEEAIVLDWKDTWALPAPQEVGFDGYFQQRFYAWLVLRTYPQIQRVTLREFYVRYSEAREATVWRDSIEDIEAELSALAERFDRAFTENDFPPSPGAHCQFCPRPGACPIFSGVRGEGAITNAEQARKVAGEATVIQAALKQRTDALKAYAGVHGHVEISDHKGKRVWGHQQSKRVSRPTREEMELALEAAGAGAALDLNSLYKEAKTTRFVAHSPKEIEDMPDDANLVNALEESLKQLDK